MRLTGPLLAFLVLNFGGRLEVKMAHFTNDNVICYSIVLLLSTSQIDSKQQSARRYESFRLHKN